MKYFSNFWSTLQIPLINCKIYLILSWKKMKNCQFNSATTFAIKDAKLYVSLVILPTQYNLKLLQQLESRITRLINWNRHQPKAVIQAQNQHLDYLIDRPFQGVSRHCQSLFEETVKNNIRTYETFRKIVFGQEDHYAVGSVFVYPYLKKKFNSYRF